MDGLEPSGDNLVSLPQALRRDLPLAAAQASSGAAQIIYAHCSGGCPKVVMCIFVIYKCLSWHSNQQQDLGKPRQATDGKLLSILSHVVSEKTQSAFRREQRWPHSLRCCQGLATQDRIKQSVIQQVVLMSNFIKVEYVCL